MSRRRSIIALARSGPPCTERIRSELLKLGIAVGVVRLVIQGRYVEIVKLCWGEVVGGQNLGRDLEVRCSTQQSPAYGG